MSALEFDAEGHNLFSGDRAGCVKIWEIFGGGGGGGGGARSSLFFRLKRELRLPELEGYSVECLRLHPGGRRLLVHSTSLVAALVMLDLRQTTGAAGGNIMQVRRGKMCAPTKKSCSYVTFRREAACKSLLNSFLLLLLLLQNFVFSGVSR